MIAEMRVVADRLINAGLLSCHNYRYVGSRVAQYAIRTTTTGHAAVESGFRVYVNNTSNVDVDPVPSALPPAANKSVTWTTPGEMLASVVVGWLLEVIR